MRDSEPKTAPPIPPRRLKRKNKSVTVGQKDVVAEGATNSVIRLEHRPRLPPPPPPQRGFPKRGIRPQVLPSSAEVSGNDIPSSYYSSENCRSNSIIEDKLLADNNDVGEIQPFMSTFGTTVRLPLVRRESGKKLSGENPPQRKREKEKEKEKEKGKVALPRPNEYPPLFFTMQDFQDVMEDAEGSSYNRTLKNMTTFEPTPKPRASKNSVNDLPKTPDEEKVLFRVTNTNLPFEKSLSELTDVRNDPGHFIFEEYVDRRQISAQRKSNIKLVLFGDDTFDREDEDRKISADHTASRVRFLVDSPNGNEKFDKIAEPDSLQNIDSLPLDVLPSQDLIPVVKLERDEDEDEFGDVPFDSLLNDPASSSLCVDLSEDSSSSKSDFQTILVTATVEKVPSVEGVEKPFENLQEIHSNIGSVEERKISRNEDVSEEPKSSCFESQGSEPVVKFETEIIASFEIPDERHEGIDATDRVKEKRKIMVDDESLQDFMDFDNNADKSGPSENLRRNSFLMDMLQGVDEPDEITVCKVVATHPKTPIHNSKIDYGIRDKGSEPRAAVEAKNKLLGELSSSFSAIKLKPVNNVVEDLEEKQGASDLKIASINVLRFEKNKEEKEENMENGVMENVKNQNDKDNDNDNNDDDYEAENNMIYKLNRNLDSVLDSNVVKCKVNVDPIIEESNKIITQNEPPQDRSNVCSQKTDDIIDKINHIQNIDSLLKDADDDTKFIGEKTKNIKTSDKNNDDDNEGNYYDQGRVDDEKIMMINNNNNNNINNNNNNNNNMKIVDVESESSVDKCAIVLKCNNNNDNNAMTPVDVSYDQSQNNVSIIPGSVRSFVKFYEIQGETSVGLNSNDTAAVPKTKVEATRNNCYTDNLKNIISNEIDASSSSSSVMEIENDIKYTIVTRKAVVEKYKEIVKNDDIMQEDNKFNDKSTKIIISGETDTHASSFIESVNFCGRETQFRTGSTFIRSKSVAENESEEAEIECRREFVSKKIDVVISTANNAASEIAPGMQDGSTSGLTKQDVLRSGTKNQLVPKSSTSTINEQYTFYCTV